MIIADLVQKEYEKLHRSTKSEKVEFVKQTLEDLLETSLTKERQIASAMATFKNKHGMPYIEDEKRDNGDRKSQFANELTKSSLEKIRITSLLRQILAIKTRIGPSSESVSSKGVNDDIAVIKEFFESGKGVYIWGDNAPYYADANYVGAALLDITMTGNLSGGKSVQLKDKTNKSGILQNHNNAKKQI